LLTRHAPLSLGFGQPRADDLVRSSLGNCVAGHCCEEVSTPEPIESRCGRCGDRRSPRDVTQQRDLPEILTGATLLRALIELDSDNARLKLENVMIKKKAQTLSTRQANAVHKAMGMFAEAGKSFVALVEKLESAQRAVAEVKPQEERLGTDDDQ
jgi:hypothetical protein